MTTISSTAWAGAARGRCAVYADSAGPVVLDWPVAVAFSVADLARPRTG
jgi:hypothetical protein